MDGPKPELASFQCPGCAAEVRLRAQGTTVTIVCRNCGTVVDADDPKAKLVAGSIRHTQKELIPLGKRAKFFGTEWEVIGMLRRSEHPWPESEEYLLFNPMKGLRWLVNFEGHWSFLVPTRDVPERSKPEGYLHQGLPLYATYNGKQYRRFHKGTEKVTFLAGEFHWRVKVGDVSKTESFVRPGEALYHDRTGNETSWHHATYLKPNEVKSAFGIPGLMPWRRGVGALQPRPAEKDRSAIFKTYWALSAAMLLVQLTTCSVATRAPVLNQTFVFDASVKEKATRTESFDVADGIDNVELRLSAPLENHWLSIEGELVNETTGDTWPFEQGVEYYSGYDSDGSWSEGSQISDKVLQGVPPGRYHVNFEPSSDVTQGPQAYYLKAVRGVPMSANFWWAWFFLSLPPLVIWGVGHYYDRERWSKSDFSPYDGG